MTKAFYYYRCKKVKQTGGDYLNQTFEDNYCGYHLSQCYNPPKPCIGCKLSGGRSTNVKTKINTVALRKMKKYVNDKYPHDKFTNHAIHYLFVSLS